MNNNEPLIKYYNKTSKTVYPTDKKKVNVTSVIIAAIVALFILPFIFCGALLLFVGCKELYDTSVSKKICTQLVHGTVIDYKEWESQDEDGTKSVSYAPVFVYEYNDKEYKYQGHSFTSLKNQDFEIGQDVDIYVSSDDASRVYIPSYNVQSESSVETVIFGGCFFFVSLIFGIVFLIKLLRSTKCRKQDNA